jgi:hypothetical protein
MTRLGCSVFGGLVRGNSGKGGFPSDRLLVKAFVSCHHKGNYRSPTWLERGRSRIEGRVM